MIRSILGAVFILLGLAGFIVEVIGNFKFDYVLKRMHAAGIGDSFSLAAFIIGCVILNGLSATSFKLIVAGFMLYFTSPVCTHMLAKLEYETRDEEKEEIK